MAKSAKKKKNHLFLCGKPERIEPRFIAQTSDD